LTKVLHAIFEAPEITSPHSLVMGLRGPSDPWIIFMHVLVTLEDGWTSCFLSFLLIPFAHTLPPPVASTGSIYHELGHVLLGTHSYLCLAGEPFSDLGDQLSQKPG